MSGKRKLFEEVGTAPEVRPAAQPGLIDRGRSDGRRAIRIWLMGLFALVVLLVAVGGLTRLTDSGLSITEWRPILGSIPPLTQEAWEAEFALYQAIPEFQIQNRWMELSDFKVIYWWEWGHRQLGRFLGLFWAIGFFWFLLRGKIPAGREGLWLPILGFVGFAGLIGVEVARAQGLLETPLAQNLEAGALAGMAGLVLWGLLLPRMGWVTRLLFLGFLGGFQGAIGWWMVASGLTGTMVDVASTRLAVHLGVAFVILGLIAWSIFLLGRPERDLLQARRIQEPWLARRAGTLSGLVFVQILIGALVAGIDAGRSYTDWPLMGGQILPASAMVLEPWWRNFIESPGLVQFIHRTVGYGVVLVGVFVWLAGRRSPHPATRAAFHWVLGALALQVCVGIVTVMSAADWPIALSHQAIAVVLWVLCLRARFLAQYPIAAKLKRG